MWRPWSGIGVSGGHGCIAVCDLAAAPSRDGVNDLLDTSQWQRLGDLFDRAVELDAASQSELLRSVERDDAELARALRSMLESDSQHHARTSEQRKRVLRGSLDAMEAPAVGVGDRVGPYVLRESLGHGGMGVVYRAERADGEVRQEVAVKIVKRTLLDASGRGRFLRERAIVAGFQHPYIARMLDVGQTADGSPYLAMELIRGPTITEYCNSNRIGPRGRIEVFLRVCEAVQHAHANLVLHRDLKPSNVLVGEDGMPKLIDFGIAKPLAVRADDEQEQTVTAHRFFSLSNVAPEQLRGEREGVACDVYQLGTLLYELLSGASVFDGAGITSGQLEQRILEEVPEAPSARASRSSEENAQLHGAATPAALARELRGDLDAIVAHTLSKLPMERYSSVEQLADELRRYLAGQPVFALRGWRWYRTRKFMRRHALALGVSGAAVALVTLFVAALWLQSQRIARERNLAQQRANEVEQIARFEGDMLKQVDPTQAGQQLMDDMRAKLATALVKAGVPESERARRVAAFAELLRQVNATDTARDQIDRTTLKPAIAAIDNQFRNQPVVAATLRQVLATRYAEMGQYDAALPLMRSALATRRRVLGEDHPDTLQSISDMGSLLVSQGKPGDAESYVREALERRRRVLGEEHPDTVRSIEDMGSLLEHQGKLGEAERYYREALEKSRRVNGQESKQTLELIGTTGKVLEAQGKFGESEPYLREAVEKMRRVLGEGNAQTLYYIEAMGWELRQQGKLAEAEPYVREALDKSRRDLGEEHPQTLDAINSMGMLLEDKGRRDEAESFFREVLEKRRRVEGEQSTGTLQALGTLGLDLEDQGKLNAAEPYFREWAQDSRRTLGENDPNTLYADVNLGRILEEQGQLVEAELFLHEAMEQSLRVDRAMGEKARVTLYAITYMGALRVAQGRYYEAEKLLAPHEAEARTVGTIQDAYIHAMVLLGLGRARAGIGEFAAAETDLLEAQPVLVRVKGPDHQRARECSRAISGLYTARNVAEPGKGYDLKAAEWKRRQAVLDASTAAAVTH